MSTNETKRFDNTKVTVIFVLGGPGAGKGTQSELLVDEFNFCHLSAGDLLRAEQKREGSHYGDVIRNCIRDGKIVPMEITIKLIENAMTAALNEGRTGSGWEDGRGRFLIDGFPRNEDQALEFENSVCLASKVIYFNTAEEVMEERLKERGKTSGRIDDNVESIKKRLQTYIIDTKPLIDRYTRCKKVVEIDSGGTVEEVYNTTSSVLRVIWNVLAVSG